METGQLLFSVQMGVRKTLPEYLSSDRDMPMTLGIYIWADGASQTADHLTRETGSHQGCPSKK